MEDDSDSPMLREFVAGSNTLVFLFGGMAGQMGMPPFEFVRAASILSCNRVFLRDAAQSWYLRGIPGVGADVDSVGRFLEAEVKASGADRVVFVGNSMGGFAALLYCALLGVGRAVCFAPQTFIDTENRRIHDDWRWSRKLSALHSVLPGTDAFDLKLWIARHRPDLKAAIHVAMSDPLDLLHAERLASFPNITINRYASGGHGLVKELRDNGSLASILGDVVT